MNEQRSKSAERLYDAIGGIDDKLIHDAATPKKAREYAKARSRHRITQVAVACLFCLVVTVIVRLPVIHNDTKEPTDTTPDTHSNSLHDKTESYTTLESMLEGASSSHQIEQVKLEDIDLLDKTAKLIWLYEGEDEYNVTIISKKSALDTIKAQLDHPATQLSRENSESVEVKVWLSYGDGTVVSPYLKHTRGNTGYGTLFDYSAEVEPSEKLTSTIHKLLN